MRELIAGITFLAAVYANFVGATWEDKIIPLAFISICLVALKHRKSFI
ncbi:MAG: hypothetical protein RSD79_06630 [Cetobacterium sp.]